MRKTFGRAFILCFLSIVLFYAPALASHEDTAQLTFSKTAVSPKALQAYTIQKGDMLSAIIRRIPGITEKDVPLYYRMTKELNPDIDDLNKLYEGQKIVLPGKSIPVPEEESATAVDTSSADTAGHQAYHVKKGDSLIRVVRRVLHIKTGTQNTLLVIKSLNPAIKDVNKIYVGQVIRLPKGRLAVKSAQAVPPSPKDNLAIEQKPNQPLIVVEEKVPAVTPQEKPPIQDLKAIEAKESIVLPLAQRLAIIKHIISQMNGSVLTGGNYYLPVSKTEQLTIDCSIIPVVELDDRTTIFLDPGNRSNNYLKKLISDRWSNYRFVKIDDKDDIIVMLKKIFKSTNTYEITKAQKSFFVDSLPSLEVIVDWVINKKGQNKSLSKTQGLRFVYENGVLLPRAIVDYARQHSLIITEISPEKGLVGKPEEIYSLPPLTVLPTSSVIDFSFALLSYLNVEGERDADIRVFNIAKDGFNLSVKADIVVTRGIKKTLIFSRNLPPQFINILQGAGNDLIFLSDQDDPAKNMEKILRDLKFAFTSGYFTFSGLDKNQPPYNFGFSGTKIKTDKDIYVVNFDFNQELRGLMQETWSANIVRY